MGLSLLWRAAAIFEWIFAIHLQDCLIGELLLIGFFSDGQYFLLVDVPFMQDGSAIGA
jgi:hypothetical protein